MTDFNSIDFSVMIFLTFIISVFARFMNLIDLGDFLILLMLVLGFLALMNKGGPSKQ